MRKAILCCLLPMVLGASSPLPWDEAAQRLLEAYDSGNPMPSSIPLRSADRPQERWLREAASHTIPANPFRTHSQGWREAESLRAFLKAPTAQGLQKLPLALEGTRLALLRWGQSMTRTGLLPKQERQAWEDRLLASPPDLIRALALRHALCFCLAEGDADRFQRLMAEALPSDSETFQPFQRAFALLGGPCPSLRLWRFPDLIPLEQPLSALAQAGVRIAPLEDFPDPPKPGWAWIISTPSGSQSARESELQDTSALEAQAILRHLGTTPAFLAPSAEELGAILPAFFPIRVEFGTGGTIRRILVGDAAQAVR